MPQAGPARGAAADESADGYITGRVSDLDGFRADVTGRAYRRTADGWHFSQQPALVLPQDQPTVITG